MMTNDFLAEAAALTGDGLGGTKFDAMAIGTDATVPAAGHSDLFAEITSGGGARKSGADVLATLITQDSTNDTMRFVATWAFTQAFSVNEFGVFNNGTAGLGVMMLRQTFADPLNVVSQDSLELTIDVKASDQVVSAVSVITFAGLEEGNKLIASDLTPAIGRINAIALGESATSLGQDDTALVDEIVTADGVGLGRGQETAGPTVTQETENVTGDTVQVESTWAVTGTIAVNEAGLFNSTSPSSGIMFVRYAFADPLNLINTDTFTMIFRLVNVA